jgi:hypothetical protein
MRTKFSREIRPKDDLGAQLQPAFDDLARVINRGLTWAENLPGAVYSVRVGSGTAVNMPTVEGLKCRGASVIFVSDGVVVSSVSYRQKNDTVEVTPTFSDGQPHEVIFFCIYV